jgi:hypothetical protein
MSISPDFSWEHVMAELRKLMVTLSTAEPLAAQVLAASAMTQASVADRRWAGAPAPQWQSATPAARRLSRLTPCRITAIATFEKRLATGVSGDAFSSFPPVKSITTFVN